MLSSEYALITTEFCRTHTIRSKYIHIVTEIMQIPKGATEQIVQILERHLIKYEMDYGDLSFNTLTFKYSYDYDKRDEPIAFMDEIYSIILSDEKLEDYSNKITSDTALPYYVTYIFPKNMVDAVVDILDNAFNLYPEIKTLCDGYCMFEIECSKQTDTTFAYKLFVHLQNSAIPLVEASDRYGKITFRDGLKVADENNGFFYRLDLKQAFKSSWEANIARLLNFKGKKYEYEKIPMHKNTDAISRISFWKTAKL